MGGDYPPTYVSPNITRQYGYTPEEFLKDPKSWIERVHPDDRDRVLRDLGELINTGIHIHEYRFRHKDGSYRYVTDRVILFRDENGKAQEMTGYMTDITDHIHSEKVLQTIMESVSMAAGADFFTSLASHLAEMLDMPYAILAELLLGEERVATVAFSANGRIADNIEYDLQGTPCESIFDKGTCCYTDGVQELFPDDVELQAIGAKSYIGTPLTNAKEMPIGLLAVIGDRALHDDQKDSYLSILQIFASRAASELERHQAEKQLQTAKEAAEKACRARSDLLSQMSHEFRTPLNSILGFAQILEVEAKKDHPGTRERKSVDYILRAGWHLLDLVNDLLDLSIIEAGRVEMHPRVIDPLELIQQCIDIIQPLAEQHNIGIERSYSCSLDRHIEADPVRIKQVLLNLLSNAAKYNHTDGSITVHCELRGERLRISITDTGPGIPADELGELFQPFSPRYLRRHSTEGTGLGLSIASKLMNLMGGDIGVESQPGKGSTFWIELEHCAPATVTTPAGSPAGTDAATAARSGEDVVILYIEDSPSHLKLVETIVEDIAGIRLLCAHTPLLGLELAKAHRPDIIILDICLPGLSGFEVLEGIQSDEATKYTPVIAVSANAMPTDIEKALRAGFRRYLTKPINVVEFRRVIRELLQNDHA